MSLLASEHEVVEFIEQKYIKYKCEFVREWIVLACFFVCMLLVWFLDWWIIGGPKLWLLLIVEFLPALLIIFIAINQFIILKNLRFLKQNPQFCRLLRLKPNAVKAYFAEISKKCGLDGDHFLQAPDIILPPASDSVVDRSPSHCWDFCCLGCAKWCVQSRWNIKRLGRYEMLHNAMNGSDDSKSVQQHQQSNDSKETEAKDSSVELLNEEDVSLDLFVLVSIRGLLFANSRYKYLPHDRWFSGSIDQVICTKKGENDFWMVQFMMTNASNSHLPNLDFILLPADQTEIKDEITALFHSESVEMV